MSASEDGPPPLEDMSELLKQVDTLREFQNKKQQPNVKQSNGIAPIKNGDGDTSSPRSKQMKTENEKMKTTTQTEAYSVKETKNVPDRKSPPAEVKTTGAFGGMKKGFLFGGPPKSKPVQSSSKPTSIDTSSKQTKQSSGGKTLEDIPFVRKNAEAKSELRFSEVQEAMEKTNSKLMENKEWVTDDLLTKLEKNEKLTKRLQEPKFMQAIGEFQKNPTEALRKYAGNVEVQEFLQDFCTLMGDHFNKLGDQQDSKKAQTAQPSQPQILTPGGAGGGADLQVRSSTNPNQPTAADEQKMQEILSNPEIQQVLMDPKIQELFEQLRNNPDNGQRLLQTASGDLKQKIHTLVQAGLLQVQKS